jgi:hypothetical protein
LVRATHRGLFGREGQEIHVRLLEQRHGATGQDDGAAARRREIGKNLAERLVLVPLIDDLDLVGAGALEHPCVPLDQLRAHVAEEPTNAGSPALAGRWKMSTVKRAMCDRV